jgi:hypothetical protein
VENSEVGDEVAYLLPAVEARSSDQPVWHAEAHEAFFEGAGLCVDAVQDRAVLVREAVVLHELVDCGDNCLGLVLLVQALGEHDRLADVVLGPEALVLAESIVGDDLGRGAEDCLRGAVILLQYDHFGVRILVLEAEDVAQVGTAPGIDGLIGVANHAEVPVFSCEELHEFELGEIRILELVDK